MAFNVIPLKLAFCKRIAQCLNPNLPSGVHLKSLQTLETVLDRIGVRLSSSPPQQAHLTRSSAGEAVQRPGLVLYGALSSLPVRCYDCEGTQAPSEWLSKQRQPPNPVPVSQ